MNARMHRVLAWVWPAVVLAVAAGCARSELRGTPLPPHAVHGIGQGYYEPSVRAFVVPPDGWEMDPPKNSDRHTHLVWLSPTRDTAYGVIYARIPGYVPVAFLPSRYLHDQVLDRFLEEMRNDQGEAVLLSRNWDAKNGRMNFVAEGGLYTIDSLMSVRGHSSWTVYVGRLRERAENPEEIELGRSARDVTRTGRQALQ